MPIISHVGRKALTTRLLIGAIYVLLTIGAITVLYPFGLMIGTSVCSAVDMTEHRLIPRYLYDDDALFMKYINDRYGYFQNFFKQGVNIQNLNHCYRAEFLSYENVKLDLDGVDPSSEGLRSRVDDWLRFKETLPSHYSQRGFEVLTTLKYAKALRERFNGNIKALNLEYLDQYDDFEDVLLPYEDPMVRSWEPEETPRWRHFRELRDSLPPAYRIVAAADAKFAQFLEGKHLSVQALNETYGSKYASFMDIALEEKAPSGPGAREDWGEFVKRQFPFRYLTLDGGEKEFRAYLHQKYANTQRMNREYGTTYEDFGDAEFPVTEPQAPLQKRDWQEFIEKQVPLEHLRIDSADVRYRNFLRQKFETVESINAAYGTTYVHFTEIAPPYFETDYLAFTDNRVQIRMDFLTRNYRLMGKHMITNGRAFWNTFVLVLGVVAGQLTIGPLCAYALSRYRLRYGYKILLFLLATMAFPAEIAMLPAFLLLKQLHLLNTYWALILPHVVNGFYVFLLKGFFDSLPQELFEVAELEGASETRIFMTVVVPLCLPIFAVIALFGFTFAYGSFMWAFVVCQDPKLWTIMVYLYELQMYNPEYLVMAALTLASIPPLIVFILAQRVIMRGIVIPVMK